jgi:hypothetical protein
MKAAFLIFCFINIVIINCKAQLNLVPNPSFEDTINCPTGLYNELGKNWFQSIEQSTTDYYHRCINLLSPDSNIAGIPHFHNVYFQNPRTGNAFIGIVTTSFFSFNQQVSGDSSISIDYRETIATRIKNILTKDKKYCGSFFANLANGSGYAIKTLGILLNADSLIDNTLINGYYYPWYPYPAQIVNKGAVLNDTMNWMKIEGTFKANGTEKYLHIGNFNKLTECGTTTNTPPQWYTGIDSMAYYLIDDVSLYELNKLPTAQNHAYNCAAQTVTLRADTGFNFRWYYLPDTINVLSTADTFVVDASTAKHVLLRATLCSTEFTDTVFVPKLDCTGIENNALAQGASLFPNPASSLATFSLQGVPPPGTRLHLTDLNGRELRSYDVTGKTTEMDVSGLANGVYFVRYQFKENVIWKGKLCKFGE